MKKLIAILALIMLAARLLAQAPQKMSYQAIVRNSADKLIVNQLIGMRVSILQGTATGTVVYSETHKPTTNNNGLASIEIGKGTVVSGTFSGINWSAGPYFIKTETDPAGGTTYSITATSQLLSVPYALHAKTATSYDETDPTWSGAANETVAIGRTGNVGIGSSADDWLKLRVNGVMGITSNDSSPWGSTLRLDAATQSGGLIYQISSLSAGSSEGAGKFQIQGGNSRFIMHNSNIGINTLNPVFTLDVRGINAGYGALMNVGNSDLSHRLVLFGGREGDPNSYLNWKQGDPLLFSTDEGGWSEKMRITSDGNVGIGTTTPTSKLDVAGDINVNNNRIQNVANPVNAQDAASKAYVDGEINQISNVNSIVTDVDGNVYKTVKIGTQVWMAENLKTTRYRNGEAIPNVTDNTAWEALTSGAWCDNSNFAVNGSKYGHIYNWYAVTDSRNIAPVGWHVATDAEWTTLENYLIANGGNWDGTSTDDKIGKSLATSTNWKNSTTEGVVGNYISSNNSSGFTALPGGSRNTSGTFNYVGLNCGWWSSTENSSTYAWYRSLYYDYVSLGRGGSYKGNGFSVRCIRD